ncbi:S-adenosyl-L-methionine-dependent methyltransferase [Echria macrotheca]|uniref:S-adenosyl-L-methionine-dependent methyltransferase n=1 Tax=Echria macrotheca TaxID=438768 RepID=A0AAJ0F9K6_9PEZI|nr:S-adenosyl-L-methionine-dependent methyltransferase [Echria macrotheca]
MATSSQTNYIHGHPPEVLKAHAHRTAARDAAYLAPHIRRDSKILDIGCGPGTISADFAALAPEGSVVCFEISEAALATARTTFASRDLYNADFVRGDATKLPFEDGSFDIVHAHQVLIHLPDPVAALREMRRVTKPGGGLVASKDMIMASVNWYPPDPRLDVWRDGITGTIAETGADPEMGRRLKAAALEAGFDEERIRVGASCWSFADREDVRFWGSSCRDRMAEGTEIRGRIVRGGYATEDEVDGFVAACSEWLDTKGAWYGCMNGELLAWK